MLEGGQAYRRTEGQEEGTTCGQEDKKTREKDRWDNSLADLYSY